MWSTSRCAYSRGYGLKYQASNSCLPICMRFKFLTRAISDMDCVIEPDVLSFSISCSLLNVARGLGGLMGGGFAKSIASSTSPSASMSFSSSSATLSSSWGVFLFNEPEGKGEGDGAGAGDGLLATISSAIAVCWDLVRFFGIFPGGILFGAGAFFGARSLGRGHSRSLLKTTRAPETHSSRRLLN